MTNSPEHSAIKKLNTLLDNDDIQLFTKEEASALKKVAKAVFFFEAFGTFGGFLKNTVVWIGVMVAFWIGIRNGFVDWLKGLQL